jgi:hypothetical protein
MYYVYCKKQKKRREKNDFSGFENALGKIIEFPNKYCSVTILICKSWWPDKKATILKHLNSLFSVFGKHSTCAIGLKDCGKILGKP